MPDTREQLPPRNTNGTYYVRPAIYLPDEPPWWDGPVGALFLVFGCFLSIWGILTLGLLAYRVGLRIFAG